MNDIMSSAAYQEFLQKRCIEITKEDETAIELGQQISKIEGELILLLSDQALKKYLEIEELGNELIAHIGPILYSVGLLGRSCFEK